MSEIVAYGTGVVVVLLVKGRREQDLPLRLGEGPRGVATQQLFGLGMLHGAPLPADPSQRPPSDSSSCFRQRWSQV